jgi:hypothetical protein
LRKSVVNRQEVLRGCTRNCSPFGDFPLVRIKQDETIWWNVRDRQSTLIWRHKGVADKTKWSFEEIRKNYKGRYFLKYAFSSFIRQKDKKKECVLKTARQK